MRDFFQTKTATGEIDDQKVEQKRAFLSALNRSKADTAEMLVNDLKARIQRVHTQIVRLEAEKYDLEKRSESQEYDVSAKKNW